MVTTINATRAIKHVTDMLYLRVRVCRLFSRLYENWNLFRDDVGSVQSLLTKLEFLYISLPYVTSIALWCFMLGYGREGNVSLVELFIFDVPSKCGHGKVLFLKMKRRKT